MRGSPHRGTLPALDVCASSWQPSSLRAAVLASGGPHEDILVLSMLVWGLLCALGKPVPLPPSLTGRHTITPHCLRSAMHPGSHCLLRPSNRVDFAKADCTCAGTNFLVRAQAIMEVGGSPGYTMTEDYALGMEMKKFGWHCR